MNKLLSSVAALALLGACTTSEIPATWNATEGFSEEELDAKTAGVNGVITSVPDWFFELPEDDGFEYATGVAAEQDLMLSRELAILAAQRAIATRIGGQLTSSTKEFTSRSGEVSTGTMLTDVERVTEMLIVDINVAGYTVEEYDVNAYGNLYQTYVLLSYRDVDQVSVEQEETFDAHNAAVEAFEELTQERADAREVSIDTLSD